jgi:Fe-S-cluster containining protein
MDIHKILSEAKKYKASNEALIRRLKKKKNNEIDEQFSELHDNVFEKIDCLKCANCCKTTSPIFYEKDIERASQALKIKPGQFVEQYLIIDEDNDYVLLSSPCPFLDSENYCLIYESRPNACREYPHTNRKKMHQLLNLSLKNTLICPAVAEIFKNLRARY